MQLSIEKYLDQMKNIQSEFLEFIEDDENVDEKFQNLCSILKKKKIRDNKHNIRLLLHHIANICTNHHHCQNFFGKIESVLKIFKEDIKKYFVNSELFNIFKKNKRILLFLIEEKMIIVDEYIIKTIIKEKYQTKNYSQYFAPEIKPFLNEKWFPKNEWTKDIEKELPEKFYELRNKGENDSYICQLVREDLVEDFIAYVNRFCISLNMIIDPSIYETNSFLIKKQNKSDNKKGITLIEYAAFFGSIQIIRYLVMQGVELKPSLWIYAIHSKNAELIHFLEECHIEPTVTVYKGDRKIEENSYNGCFKESIKCNHNDIANYFLNNYLKIDDQMPKDTFIQILKYYNFAFIQKDYVNESSFYLICKYDYYLFASYLLTNKDIKINNKIIQNNIF